MTDYLEKAQKATFTTLLLLPAIGASRRSLVKYGFINGYLDDRNHEIHYTDAVYLLFKPESWEKFELHLERERKAGGIMAQYDYAGGYIVLVYSMLEKYLDQYELFKEGSYSKMSDEYKDMFPKFVRISDPKTGVMEDVLSLPYMIFSRAKGLREMWEEELQVKFSDIDPDMEVWGKPTQDRETLDIEQIRTDKLLDAPKLNV